MTSTRLIMLLFTLCSIGKSEVNLVDEKYISFVKEQRLKDFWEELEEMQFTSLHDESMKFSLDTCLSYEDVQRLYSINWTSPTDSELLKICPALFSRAILSNSCDHKDDVKHWEAKKLADSAVEPRSMATVYGTVAILLCSMLSLLGIPLVLCDRNSAAMQIMLQFFIGLAVSSMACDAILHLWPMAVELHSPHHPGSGSGVSGEAEHDHEGGGEGEGDEVWLWRSVAVVGAVYLFYIFETLMHQSIDHRHTHSLASEEVDARRRDRNHRHEHGHQNHHNHHGHNNNNHHHHSHRKYHKRESSSLSDHEEAEEMMCPSSPISTGARVHVHNHFQKSPEDLDLEQHAETSNCMSSCLGTKEVHGSCGGGGAADFSNLDAGVGEKGEQEVDPLMNGSIVCSNTATAADTCSSVTIHGGVGVSSGILKNCSHVITVSSCRDRERRNSVYAGDIDHAGTTVCTAASSSQPQDSTAGVIPKPNSCCKSTNGANSTNEQKSVHAFLKMAKQSKCVTSGQDTRFGIPEDKFPLVMMIMLGDMFHNLADGLAVGAAFGAGQSAGLATSIAVIFHELPHELGDFAILFDCGIPIVRILVLNAISSMASFLGLYIGLFLSEHHSSAYQWIFALTAGMFIYVAFIDMLPQMMHVNTNSPWIVFGVQNMGLVLGFCLMLSLALFESQSHSNDNSH